MTRQSDRFVARRADQVQPHDRASGYDTEADARRSAELFNRGIGVSIFVDDFHDGILGDGVPYPWAVVDTGAPA